MQIFFMKQNSGSEFLQLLFSKTIRPCLTAIIEFTHAEQSREQRTFWHNDGLLKVS